MSNPVASAVADLWCEAVPRPVNAAEGEMLSQMLVNLMAKLRERGVAVPDVTILKEAKDPK